LPGFEESTLEATGGGGKLNGLRTGAGVGTRGGGLYIEGGGSEETTDG